MSIAEIFSLGHYRGGDDRDHYGRRYGYHDHSSHGYSWRGSYHDGYGYGGRYNDGLLGIHIRL